MCLTTPYVLLDEQTVLLIPWMLPLRDSFSKPGSCFRGKNINYLIVNHMEPDHCAMIGDIVRRYPAVKIVGNTKTFGMMNQFFGTDFLNVLLW